MRTTCNGLTGFDSLTFRQVYGVENTVMVDRSWYSVLRDWQLRQDEGNARAMSDGACVASVVRCWVAGGV
jgi:hypothetical protein